jgi:hypothetical protein
MLVGIEAKLQSVREYSKAEPLVKTSAKTKRRSIIRQEASEALKFVAALPWRLLVNNYVCICDKRKKNNNILCRY